MQIWQLRQETPAPVAIDRRYPAPAARRRGDFTANPLTEYSASLRRALQNPILDAAQQAKLAELVKVLDRSRAASEAIVTGVISAGHWPGQTLCLYPIHVYMSEFDLSDSQVRRFELLQEGAREPMYAQIAELEKDRSELLNSGLRVDSPAVIQLTSDISKLHVHLAATRPPRDLALAVLDDAQKARLADFETALDLVREAIEIKLIPTPPKGEILCQ